MSNMLQPGSALAHLREINPDVRTCDNDGFECIDGHGNENFFMCCHCYRQSAISFGPTNYSRAELCKLCARRAK